MTAFTERAVTPLCVWSNGQLAALAEAFHRGLADWAGAWGVDRADKLCASAATPQDLDFEGQVLGTSAAFTAWLLDRQTLLHQLHSRLFDAELREGSLAAEIASTCAEDLLGHLRSSLRLAAAGVPMPTPCALAVAWTGWVTLRSPFGVALLLPPEGVEWTLEQAGCLRRSPARHAQPALESIDQALAAKSLCLNVELQGCEVAIGVLQDLQLGDVLRLKHRLDKPGLVRHCDGSALFSGYLVRRGAQKSLELAPLENVQEELQ